MKVTADDIAQLLASQPPRKVPAHVRSAAQGRAGLWIGLLFGLAFGTFGMFFVWLFFPWRVLDDWRLDAEGENTPGIVRSVIDTNMSINDTQVVEYVFAYLFSGRDALTTSCYTTGRSWREGDQITVRYLPDEPAIACIEGARLSKGGGVMGVAVLILPAVGYGLIVGLLITRRRDRLLLEKGKVAEVDVLAVDATRMQMNYQTVYKITLSPLPESGGQQVVVKRWSTAEINLLTNHALRKQPIFVLYDPRRPKKLLFPEALIGV